MNIKKQIESQIKWSEKTFGPGMRLGVIDHIQKELKEILEDPTDLSEWIDVFILAIDGAWRAGYNADQILEAYNAKMKKNMLREWPDWRTIPNGKAIEHVRGKHD